jgi:hypothetical protein
MIATGRMADEKPQTISCLIAHSQDYLMGPQYYIQDHSRRVVGACEEDRAVTAIEYALIAVAAIAAFSLVGTNQSVWRGWRAMDHG